jgi:hypothetical protein
MVPLAVGAVALASCGVSPGPRLDGTELPPVETVIEADPGTGPVGTTVPASPTDADPAAPSGAVGQIERVDVIVPGFVTVTGWATDTSSAAPMSVTAWLDLEQMHTVVADEPSSASAAGSTHAGFAFDLPIGADPAVVCVTIAPDGAAPFDCVDVAGRAMDDTEDDADADTEIDPGVSLTAVTPDASGSVAIRGVVTGPADRTPPTVTVASTTGTITDVGSDDPVTQVAVAHQAFRFEVYDLADGTWSVCAEPFVVSLQERRPSPAAADGCGTIVIGDRNIGTTGRAVIVDAVGPPPEHPLYLMERDAGVSVVLSDGSTMWFFGDSMQEGLDRNLLYFVNNTAAWASADDPTVTHDAISAEGEPFLFAEPSAAICAASDDAKPALWPEAAVVIPRGDGTDRVVVVMSKMCLGDDWLDFETMGFAVAEVVYDPDDPPVNRPIVGEITQPDLAPAEAGYGRAMLLGPDGYLYGYQCGSYPGAWGPCRAARVSPADVTDPNAWRVWNGDDWTDPANWVADRTAATAMELSGSTENMLPIAAFGVDHHADFDAYLMVYSPWPGFCSELDVRVADAPVGPWTEPVPITLPDCSGEDSGVAQHCYAATPQMQMCIGDELGGGYFDLQTPLGVGRYFAFATPFVVAPRA